MKRARIIVVAVLLVGLGAAGAWAHEEHGEGGQQALTGEVVDVVCYLSHGPSGLGKDHAGCAQKCIKNGLPVALKVGDQLYLLANADHTPANAKLADLAAKQVTVHGTVLERDGQHLLVVSSVEESR